MRHWGQPNSLQLQMCLTFSTLYWPHHSSRRQAKPRFLRESDMKKDGQATQQVWEKGKLEAWVPTHTSKSAQSLHLPHRCFYVLERNRLKRSSKGDLGDWNRIENEHTAGVTQSAPMPTKLLEDSWDDVRDVRVWLIFSGMDLYWQVTDRPSLRTPCSTTWTDTGSQQRGSGHSTKGFFTLQKNLW